VLPKEKPARAEGEADRLERGEMTGASRGLAVDGDQEKSAPVPALDQAREGFREGGCMRERFVAEREERMSVASEPSEERTVVNDDVRAQRALRRGAIFARAGGGLRPGDRRTVRTRGIRRSKDPRARRFACFAQRAESVVRARERELRRTVPGHEISAPDPSRLLHGLVDLVDRREAARQELTLGPFAHDDSVASQERTSDGCSSLGRRRHDRPAARTKRPPTRGPWD